jgi:hypothetical protein
MFQLARTAALAAATFAMSSAAASAATTMKPADSFGGVLNQLHHHATIGSTVDPINGDGNPYGLALSPITSGALHLGDLVVCNFNDALNIQGLGTTIEVLRPAPGSQPHRLIGDPRLTGCAALALGPAGDPWIAAYDANDNPIVIATGQFVTALNTYRWAGPWGQTFSGTPGPRGVAAFYESNAIDGSVVRINISKAGFSYDKIAFGFSVNHGVPGGILAPAGLTYDAARDRLYIVDSNVNRVVYIDNPGSVPAGGIMIRANAFAGPSAASAHVLFAGGPLQSPISSALLFNGDLIVGNTANNDLVEFSPAGALLATRSVDSGNPGALFGIVAAGTSLATTHLYFNDDNDNTVKELFP